MYYVSIKVYSITEKNDITTACHNTNQQQEIKKAIMQLVATLGVYARLSS